MSVALTNLRRRMFTVLLTESSEVRAIRIPVGTTVANLPDSVLALESVAKAMRLGELLVKRERTVRS